MEGKKILLVDDQRFALKLLRDSLVPIGFVVEEAYDGNMAFEKAIEFQPDIILMDVVMPGVDGVEACRRMKEDSRTRAIPVIIVTAKKEEEHLTAAFDAGADDYITKPFARYELRARIKSNLLRSESMTLVAQKARESEALLEISQTLTSTLNTEDILHIIVKKIAENIEVTRCSITKIGEDDSYGHVLASSDAPDARDIRIELDKYPEIREVIRTGQSLLLEDARNHPIMAEVKDHISALSFNAILVLPVIYKNEVIGTLMLRTARKRDTFSEREIRFCQLVANVSANALKNARLYELVREESFELREEKTRIEEELRAKEVYESLFEHASEGLMALNARGEAVYMNRGALDIFGYTREEGCKLSLHNFLSEESYHDALHNHINFFLGREYKNKLDLFINNKAGEKRCVSVSFSSHRLLGSFCILSFADVTDERKRAHDLKEANARLKDMDRVKSEFINTATHELRVPVTVIHGYLSLVDEMGAANLTEKQMEYLKAANDCVDRMMELIDDLLDLAKLRDGKLELRHEEKSIMEPIREVYAVLAPFASQMGLKMRVESLDEDLMAVFDHEKIQRVLTNLVGNAMKFTPKGGTIEISVGKTHEEIHISVTDTGEGIPENYLSRIFDEFCQVRTSTVKVGTGLGLSICKRIVDAHKGKIWVKSAMQKGSQFTFSLPINPPL